MNLNYLLEQIDNLVDNNKNYYCNKNLPDKDISGILYFNDNEFKTDNNFLKVKQINKLYNIKKNNTQFKKIIKEDNFKKLDINVSTHININDFNLSKSYYDLTECILSLVDYHNYNGKNIFFKKMLKDFDIYKLFKKYNYKRYVKKSKLRNLLINKDDNNNFIKQFLSDYLNMNIILFSNDIIKFFCKDRKYEVFRPTIIIYNFENRYYFLNDKKNKNIFTSDDNINIKLKKIILNEEIINNKQKEEKKQSDNKKQTKEKIQKEEEKQSNNKKQTKEKIQKEEEKQSDNKKVIEKKPQKEEKKELKNINKLKVKELRELCLKYNINIKKNINGKLKNKLKKELLNDLKNI